MYSRQKHSIMSLGGAERLRAYCAAPRHRPSSAGTSSSAERSANIV